MLPAQSANLASATLKIWIFIFSTSRFKAREAAQVASLPKRTTNRHPPAGAGAAGEPRFPGQTPAPGLRSGRHKKPSLPRPPPKSRGQFPSFLTPTPCSARRCPGSAWGPPMPATFPSAVSAAGVKPDQAQPEAKPSLIARRRPSPASPAGHLSVPLTDGTATKSHQTSNSAAWDNPAGRVLASTERELTEETGLLLLTSDLRQSVPAWK
ncbi:uncharacterized protein LOC141728627 [Zonotrichia albicollis]|uniref:uncharacterized protein LOC141728627 n=1 Tax=Zonotrichia albicollis TaxID=44394 RepID=UPI003D812571